MSVDISEVKITFGNGIKREDYGPVKRAEATITAIVAQGQDGQAALDHISAMAQAKVRELLTIEGQVTSAKPAPAAPVTGEDDEWEQPAAPTVQDGGEVRPVMAEEAEPPRRKRRTKAEMEAARAAEASAPAIEVGATATTPAADDWSAPEVPTITDADINHACSVTAERTKDPAGVKKVIGSFSPGGDAWDPAKPGGRRFSVFDIPAAQRPDLLEKLKAL